ncbi:trigger factor [Chitinophaga terrae (ex Kim and Jung 2007)]|jgi:trigger factor|uniref:trigger factor n=1 Tax=Chitinophaga terrae (ex Kim and Jung 2007) TaxID=408074 RepID=UPI002784FC75|nr:trigger factor [Chitinophaga terrae (ex Kim and Jung 2007)]MDQ0107965.1 trigger factor [Chitinophaga terrae (ex Kim and Jung 2007)]
MATVTRENIGLLNDKITVKVSQEDYLPNFDKAVKQFSKQANIPGFRKGMVPAGMIKKMHGQALFGDEVLKTVEKELMGYVQAEKLEIFGQPLSLDKEPKNLDFNNPAEYSFEFEVGLKPSFEITPLENNKTTLTRYKVTVTDEMVNDEVTRLQLKGGKTTEPETITSEDNVINVKFEESDAKGNLVEGGIVKENSLLVKYFSASIQEQLMGKKIDDSIVFQLATSFDEQRLGWILKDLGFATDDKEAAQKYFKLTITKVGLIEKRELNEEFFKEVYPGEDITTEEAFRAKLKEEIGKYWDIEARNHMHNDLFEVLVHETPIDLPKDFLKRWLQVGGEKPKTAEEAENEYPSFDHQLRWTLISDKLIKDNKLEVSFDELKENAKQKVLGYYGGAAADGAEWLDSYLDRLLQDEKFVDQTYREMITTKLFDLAETKVNVKEEEIKAEDFVNLPHKHHHHEH